MLHPEIVYVVDDDRGIRESMCSFFSAHDIHAQAFASAREYVEHRLDAVARCLILDVHLPLQNGLALQHSLINGVDSPPIIFMTGDGDPLSTVKAMKAGALDFLVKPVDLKSLLDTVQQAFIRDKRTRQRLTETLNLQERFQRLTAREREVLPLVIGGFLNKQAASILGIAEVTLQVHRAQIMRKMEASSLPDLVRISIRLGVRHAVEQRPPSNTATSFAHSFGAFA